MAKQVVTPKSQKPYARIDSSKVAEGAVAYKAKGKSLSKLGSANLSYDMMDDKSLLDLMKTTRAGIKYNQFVKYTQRIPFSIEDWSSFLHLSVRSMLRYKKEKKTFDPIQAEKILQIVMLYQSGVALFGEQERFDKWLDSRIISLGGIKPKSLLDNSFGIAMVRDQLGRIAHGVLA